MKIGAALSTKPEARSAATEATLQAAHDLGEREPNLAIVFASAHFAPQAEAIVDAVHEAAAPPALAGCVAEGVVGTGKEVEEQPAVSVWLASLDTRVRTFHCQFSQIDGHAAFSGWPEGPAGAYLLIADPFSFPADLLLKSMNERAPASPFIAGGVASGGRSPGETRLFMDRKVMDSGAVGVALTGNVEVVALVSQGCRPIGQVLTVTRSEGNRLPVHRGEGDRLRPTPDSPRGRHPWASPAPPSSASGIFLASGTGEMQPLGTRLERLATR